MKIAIRGLAACLILLATWGLAIAEPWGEIREATQNLNVRAGRGTSFEKTTALKKGDQVKVDFLQDGWYAIFPLEAQERDEAKAMGYSRDKYLKFISKPEPVVEPEPVAEPEPAPIPQPVTPQLAPGEQTAVRAPVEQPVPEAAKAPAMSPRSDQPVKINAERMTYSEDRKAVAFKGKVVAEHADLKLWSETLTAHFSSGKGGKNVDKIDRIVAEGGVRVERGSTTGTCKTLTYTVTDGVLRMEGGPKLVDGENTVTGQVIKFYLKDSRSEVIGGTNQPVEAIFYTPGGLEAP